MNWLENLKNYTKQAANRADIYLISVYAELKALVGNFAIQKKVSEGNDILKKMHEFKQVCLNKAVILTQSLYSKSRNAAKNIDIKLGFWLDKIVAALQAIANSIHTFIIKVCHKFYKGINNVYQSLKSAIILPFVIMHRAWKQALKTIRTAARNTAAKPGMWYQECAQMASVSREVSNKYIKGAAKKLTSKVKKESFILLKDNVVEGTGLDASFGSKTASAGSADKESNTSSNTGQTTENNRSASPDPEHDDNEFSIEKVRAYFDMVCTKCGHYYDKGKSFSQEEFRMLSIELKEMLHSRDEKEEVYSPVYRAINKKPNRAVMLMFTAIAVLLVSGGVWASVTEIKGYVSSIGKIDTYDQLQNITPYDGAIIKSILVKEDQAVTKGQELILLDSAIFEARHKDLQEKYYSKLARIAVIEAHLNNHPLALDLSIKDFSSRVYEDAMSLYAAKVNLHNTTITSFDGQISHKEKEIFDSKTEQSLYVEHIDLVQKQVDILTKLSANELVSKLKLLDMQKELLTTKMKLKTIEGDLMRKEGDLKGIQDKKESYLSNFNKDTLSELADNRNDLSSTLADLTMLQTQLGRTVVTSPIDGIVYKIANRSVSSHISSSQEVISIVPSTGRLVMKAMVAPDEIGFIKKGQAVSIKIATFDYSIYGDLKGTVEMISPDTVQDKTDGKYYYQVVVKSQNNYLEHKGHKLYIKPGMRATADFSLDTRTVMQYIFNPFVKVMSESLSEH